MWPLCWFLLNIFQVNQKWSRNKNSLCLQIANHIKISIQALSIFYFSFSRRWIANWPHLKCQPLSPKSVEYKHFNFQIAYYIFGSNCVSVHAYSLTTGAAGDENCTQCGAGNGMEAALTTLMTGATSNFSCGTYIHILRFIASQPIFFPNT